MSTLNVHCHVLILPGALYSCSQATNSSSSVLTWTLNFVPLTAYLNWLLILAEQQWKETQRGTLENLIKIATHFPVNLDVFPLLFGLVSESQRWNPEEGRQWAAPAVQWEGGAVWRSADFQSILMGSCGRLSQKRKTPKKTTSFTKHHAALWICSI